MSQDKATEGLDQLSQSAVNVMCSFRTYRKRRAIGVLLDEFADHSREKAVLDLADDEEGSYAAYLKMEAVNQKIIAMTRFRQKMVVAESLANINWRIEVQERDAARTKGEIARLRAKLAAAGIDPDTTDKPKRARSN